MKFIETQIKDLFIIEPEIHIDNRGLFFESFNLSEFHKIGLKYNFIQDNQSFSKYKGTLRGLHFQNAPHTQTKLVRVIRGKVMDVVVDLRKESQTYLKWFSIELSEENHRQLLIPPGFAHGFITLKDNTVFLYKVDNYYNVESDRSIHYADKEIGINWGFQNPIVSDKDKNAPTLRNCDVKFQ